MTIKEIAKLAGVSISTVSKIVNNKDDNINQETRSRVLKIVKEYNYVPYGTVKTVSNAKTFLLGVLLKDISHSGRMLRGILKSADEHGYSIMLFDCGNSSENELKHITSLCKNKVDGVLWEPFCEESMEHEHYFTDLDICVCYINSTFSSDAFFVDYKKLGYLSAQKLIAYQHQKIGCLIKEDSFRSQQVLEGFKKCLFDHQLSFHDNMMLSISDPDWFSAVTSYGMTGIVSSHFACAVSFYQQIDKLHYRIPSDFSIISLRSDSREFTGFPPVSSYEIPYFRFGYESCNALILKCEKSTEPSLDFLSEITEHCLPDHEESLSIPSNFRNKKIIVVGSINTDITFTVDCLPQTGKATLISNSSACPGGKGANQSVGCAKLGHEAVLIGKIGNDMESNFIFDILEKEKVAIAGVHRDPDTQTGKAYIYIEKNGEGTITILPGANLNLTKEDLTAQEHLFEHAGFCLLSTEIPMDTIVKAAELSRKYGAKTILKPAAQKSLPDCLYEMTDILVPNRKEAAALCPDMDSYEEQADYFFQKGIPVVIITLGHKGCYLKAKNISRYFPATSFSAVDTTGGADAFIAAFSVYLSNGYTLEQAVQIAQYAAGFCISRQGVLPALIDKNTLESHISQTEPELFLPCS